MELNGLQSFGSLFFDEDPDNQTKKHQSQKRAKTTKTKSHF